MIYKEDNTGVKYIDYFMFLKNIEKNPQDIQKSARRNFPEIKIWICKQKNTYIMPRAKKY